ncbi:Replicative DNA helicase [hydrothermal vent metagenome]|uniref:DNA 5'-3' helicase n=1 Tax=hydrothermal vent metagenome TaxID=652676 RepID=A0A1W1BHB0_9ZZZZ
MSDNMYNLNIERAVLSSIIFDPQIFEEIASKLEAQDFHLPFHQHVFIAMEDLSREDKPIDEEFLKTKLKAKNNYNEIALLDILTANAISNTDAYIEEIKLRSTKRALATLATTIRKVTIEDDLPTEEIMNLVEKKLYEITQNSTTEDFRESKEITLSMIEEINRLKALGNAKLLGIDTGFRNLNDKTQGFGKGDLVIIAARPAMGKTSLCLNMTQRAIERGEGVAFFSLEMPAEQLMLRLLSTETSIPLQKLRVGDLTDEQWTMLSRAADTMATRKLFVDDGGYATIHHVRSKLRKLKSQHPEITMAIIDYLQLMSGDNKEGRQQVISEISRGLKQLARELEIPILALSQLNRGVESRDNKRPMLSDLRESGCLSGDSIIVDSESGKLYRIDELVENKNLLPIKTKSMDKDLKVNSFTITNAFFSGEKLTYKLTTKSGKTINATANHKFYRVDGWIRLDNLKIGDKIATPNGVNLNVKKDTLCDNELILLAHLLGDGSILKGQPYHYTNEDMQNINVVKEVAKELFNIDARIVQQKNWWHVYLTSPYPLTHNKKHPITLWYERLNIERVRSYDKRVPKAVFESSNRAIKLFLKHLWATDGSITMKKKKNRNTITVYYATTSYILGKQVQSLLLRLGIISTIREVKQIKGEKEYRPSYHISVQGKENLDNFLNNVGSFGKRGENSEAYLRSLAEIKTNPNNGCIDKMVWQTYIKEAKDKRNFSWRVVCEKLNMSYCGSTLFKSGISKDRMQKLAEFLDSKKINNLAYSDIYWDEIISIEKNKKEKTYDLTVDSVHNFVANDIIVHNSIEQDADIVMFVYRDDVYREAAEKEKEMKAKANGQEYENKFQGKMEEDTELILGKHRNGPTGTVKLIFQKQFTRFVDAHLGDDPYVVEFENTNIDTRDTGKFELPVI